MRRTMMAVAALAMLAGMAACGSDSSSDLVGPTWQWTGLVETQPAHQSAVPDPENYTLTFADDGNFQAKADCNQVSGSYEEDGDSLTLQPGPSTLVACPEGSLGDQYVALLHAFDTFAVDGDQLTVQLAAGAGEMQFTKA
jgi:heat shock protein HslJ